jgi:hypothetical protein
MKERSGNVIENKGLCLENREGNWNVIENKYSYAQSVGMLLKIKEVAGMSVGGGRTGFIPDSGFRK